MLCVATWGVCANDVTDNVYALCMQSGCYSDWTCTPVHSVLPSAVSQLVTCIALQRIHIVFAYVNFFVV